MANSDKNIIITPAVGSSSTVPSINLTGAGNSTISVRIPDGNTGSLSFNGSAGNPLFSIDTNQSSGTLFNVSDINSITSVEVSTNNISLGSKSGKVIVGSSGVTLPSYPKTGLPVGEEGVIVYDNTSKCVKVNNSKAWVPIGFKRSGLTADDAGESSLQIITDYPDSPTGWYWLLINNTPQLFWIDMVYNGGGYVLVLNNRINTSGMTGLYYIQATKNPINYAGSYGYTGMLPSNFNLWVGLDTWTSITTANDSPSQTTNNVVEIVATQFRSLGNVYGHTKRASWKWNGTWSGTYAWTGASNAIVETGGSLPGLYTYHIASGFSLTTFDVDQDLNGANCSGYYNNNPWWYGSCWSGNGFAGGSGYNDAWYWDSSGPDYHNYGALYIR
jgi:hypothetical protein